LHPAGQRQLRRQPDRQRRRRRHRQPAAGRSGSCGPGELVGGEGNVIDILGSNNGTLVGGVTFAAGKVGQGFNFSGTNRADVPDSPSLALTGAVTLEAWVNPSAVVASTPTVLPRSSFLSWASRNTKTKTCSWTSRGSRCRILVRLEWSGVDSLSGRPRKARSDRPSAQRQAMPRWESR